LSFVWFSRLIRSSFLDRRQKHLIAVFRRPYFSYLYRLKLVAGVGIEPTYAAYETAE
jgi:hypothetical protein